MNAIIKKNKRPSCNAQQLARIAFRTHSHIQWNRAAAAAAVVENCIVHVMCLRRVERNDNMGRFG